MDYPLHQTRLLTKLVSHIVQYVGAQRLSKLWDANQPSLLDEKNKTNMLCHGLSTACKAFSTWDAQAAALEGRMACGGNGFSKYANFGNLWADGEVNVVGEGDNHILLMETGKFLFKNLGWMQKGKSMLDTCEFLAMKTYDKSKFEGEMDAKLLK